MNLLFLYIYLFGFKFLTGPVVWYLLNTSSVLLGLYLKFSNSLAIFSLSFDGIVYRVTIFYFFKNTFLINKKNTNSNKN